MLGCQKLTLTLHVGVKMVLLTVVAAVPRLAEATGHRDFTARELRRHTGPNNVVTTWHLKLVHTRTMFGQVGQPLLQ